MLRMVWHETGALLSNIFAVVLAVNLQCFSTNGEVFASLVHLEESGVRWDPRSTEKALQAMWAILYADDACIPSRTAQGLVSMMLIVVEVCIAFGLTLGTHDRRYAWRRRIQMYRGSMSQLGGRTYAQTASFVHLGGIVPKCLDFAIETNRHA